MTKNIFLTIKEILPKKIVVDNIAAIKDENIGNHRYIINLILRIYWRNINKYFGKKIW